MAENRWGKRFVAEIPVRFGEEKLDQHGLVQDLSVFGFFVFTKKTYPVDTILKLEISTRDGISIELIGIVRWSKERPQPSAWLIRDAGFGILIKTFLSGQEHYESLCQQLCRECAQEIKSTCPVNIEDGNTHNFNFMRRFFSRKS
ncbi:MAG: PilZ domain-containing protein [Deltaproteobacteria bacterium]|nr:PilZ domain-containing protein [Deltaproteobacteria bacterium]